MMAKKTPSASQSKKGMYSNYVMCLPGWITERPEIDVMLLDITHTVVLRTHRVAHGMRRCVNVC